MTELLIDGDWLPAAGPAVYELIDPASRKLLEPIRSASLAQRQAAVGAARSALDGWSRRSGEARAALILSIVDEIRQAAGGLAERQAIESGQPLRECQDLVAQVIRRLRDLGAASGPADSRVRKLPRQALWPFWEDTLKALCVGATIVCELPADRALTALAVARYAHMLPAGVLNVVTVEADEEQASDVATDFVFVGQDANLDIAVAGAAALRLYNSGQRPGQSARIHVDASLAYLFADRLHEYLAFLEAGEPRKPVTDLGPLRCESALHRATEHLANALKQGALVKLGGRPYQPWGLRGFFLQPTLLVEGTGTERAPHESIAGPVVIISPTADIGAALRQSVGTGQSAVRLSAFTQQADKLERSLDSAGFERRTTGYVPLVERAWTQPAAPGVDVEWIEAAQPDWFPYKKRRGMKL